jgi:hypothetical protein
MMWLLRTRQLDLDGIYNLLPLIKNSFMFAARDDSLGNINDLCI